MQGAVAGRGELTTLPNRKIAALIDTVNPREGKQLDFINSYQCPGCNGQMSPSTDSQRTHIPFETCEECGGSFFDAGEFQGFSARSLASLFRKILKKGDS